MKVDIEKLSWLHDEENWSSEVLRRGLERGDVCLIREWVESAEGIMRQSCLDWCILRDALDDASGVNP